MFNPKIKATKIATKRFCFTRAQLDEQLQSIIERIDDLSFLDKDMSLTEIENKASQIYTELYIFSCNLTEEKKYL